jgi:hypothetical protein
MFFFIGRDLSWYKNEPIEIEFLQSSLSQNKVSEMNRVKGTSKESHPLDMSWSPFVMIHLVQATYW